MSPKLASGVDQHWHGVVNSCGAPTDSGDKGLCLQVADANRFGLARITLVTDGDIVIPCNSVAGGIAHCDVEVTASVAREGTKANGRVANPDCITSERSGTDGRIEVAKRVAIER